MYNIGNAFKQIEDDLIGSMIRNLDHHRAEELKEGFNWSQWQVEQLAALDEYKKRNLKKYKGVFGDINNRIDEIIAMQRQAGKASQEISILKAMKEGAKLHKAKKEAGIDGRFFKTNDRKLNALVKATKNDFKKAEYAMLRMSNDRYRQVIFNAQLYANMGASTYEKAVDMATRDFLRAGLNCVEYKNGARHTISDYADMAIKTANKRAYLTGEGEKRQEWGVSTVIMNKRGNPCPLCMPFVGKIFIDDVWSGGKATDEDGKYPLLSSAIAKGLYHPRCKDHHTTYFAFLHEDDEEPPAKEEKEELISNYNHEQKVNHAKSEAEKYDRIAKYSLDPENKRTYQARAKQLDVNANKKQKVSNKSLDRMNLEELKDKAKEEAIKYYKSGKSGISFGDNTPEDIAEKLANRGSKTSLKKDIKALRKKNEMLAKSAKGDIIKVNRTEIVYKPDTITEKVNRKGGVDRNYYGPDGKQKKQISNNNHGSPKSHPWGKNGEHAHDYMWDGDKLINRPGRELTEIERKENGDIL